MSGDWVWLTESADDDRPPRRVAVRRSGVVTVEPRGVGTFLGIPGGLSLWVTELLPDVSAALDIPDP